MSLSLCQSVAPRKEEPRRLWRQAADAKPAGRCPPYFPQIGKTATRKGEIPVIKSPGVQVSWRVLEAMKLISLEQEAWKATGSPPSKPKRGLIAPGFWDEFLPAFSQKQVVLHHPTRASPSPYSWVILTAVGYHLELVRNAESLRLKQTFLREIPRVEHWDLSATSHLGTPILVVMATVPFVWWMVVFSTPAPLPSSWSFETPIRSLETAYLTVF